MWEAFCISIWILSQREMLGVKRSDEKHTMQSKSTFQLGVLKACRDVTVWTRYGVETFFWSGSWCSLIGTRVMSLLWWQFKSLSVHTFTVSVLGNPLSSQSGESLKLLKCNVVFIRKKQNRVLCVYHLVTCAWESVRLYSVNQKWSPETVRVPALISSSNPQPITHTSDSFLFLYPSLHPSSSMLFHRHKPMFCFVFSPLCF